MRLSAYKTLIDSAHILPTSLKGNDYFKTTGFSYDPRQQAINTILNKARKDTEALYHFEFVELYRYSARKEKYDK